MNNLFRYAIIRFRPFVETGEFANVGVVVFWPDGRLAHHKIVPRRFRRITQFFVGLNAQTFSDAVGVLKEELERLEQLRIREGTSVNFAIADAFGRARDTVWIFSEMRAVKTNDAPMEISEKLYNYYVGRNFVTEEFQENVIARRMRKTLLRNGIRGYHEYHVNDDVVSITLPLASQINGLRIIKPISLNQKTAIAIVDHAATWQSRFRYLIKNGKLNKDGILIPVQGPIEDGPTAFMDAFHEARGTLEGLDVKVVDSNDDQAVISFALLGAEPGQPYFH